jgi:hypothetical protein
MDESDIPFQDPAGDVDEPAQVDDKDEIAEQDWSDATYGGGEDDPGD